MRHLLLLLTYSSVLFAAPPSKTEVTHLVTPGDAPPAAVDRAVAEHLQALTDGKAVPIDIVCVLGGAMSQADCASARREIEKTAGTEKVTFETLPAPVLFTEKPKPKSELKGLFSFLRTVTAGTTVGVTVTLTKGADIIPAIGVATIAAAWSGAMQYWNTPYLNWLAHKNWGKTSDPQEHERAGLVTRWLKKMSSTATYGILLTAGFYATGLNHEVPGFDLVTRLAFMVGDSLYNQTAWQALNQRWTQDAVKADPAHKYYYRRWSQVGSLALSGANIATNALNIGGSHWGMIISLVVGTTGNVIAFEQWRRHRHESPKCEAAFTKFSKAG